jgi:hypothetical protein
MKPRQRADEHRPDALEWTPTGSNRQAKRTCRTALRSRKPLFDKTWKLPDIEMVQHVP